MRTLLRPLGYLLVPLLVLALLAVTFLTDEPSPTPPPPAATDRVKVDADSARPATKATPDFSPGTTSFAVKVRDDVIPYEVLGLFIMPGETVALEAVFTQGRGAVTVSAEQGALTPTGPERWTWTAPDRPGLYPIHVTETRAGETITLNAFVKVPFSHDRRALNGYEIGRYQARPLRGNPVYDRPDGFVEVTPANRNVRVAPHFTLGQFLCKQDRTDYPQYLLLRERLLLKLEMILEEVNDRGVPAPTLHVMSGFRTPHYNASIGNRTKYSRHLYGGAADIFVDVDADGAMDDLNDDGRVTRA
ncbi:MAG: hypothetical protein GVY18_09800, partial [Bacteroidetes bacterium]|nr:hypothetical protein [Bacteroidota bacterium]